MAGTLGGGPLNWTPLHSSSSSSSLHRAQTHCPRASSNLGPWGQSKWRRWRRRPPALPRRSPLFPTARSSTGARPTKGRPSDAENPVVDLGRNVRRIFLENRRGVSSELWMVQVGAGVPSEERGGFPSSGWRVGAVEQMTQSW